MFMTGLKRSVKADYYEGNQGQYRMALPYIFNLSAQFTPPHDTWF
jgi:hypothetical protein